MKNTIKLILRFLSKAFSAISFHSPYASSHARKNVLWNLFPRKPCSSRRNCLPPQCHMLHFPRRLGSPASTWMIYLSNHLALVVVPLSFLYFPFLLRTHLDYFPAYLTGRTNSNQRNVGKSDVYIIFSPGHLLLIFCPLPKFLADSQCL